MARFDAILVPGGGVREGGLLPQWVVARLDRAAELHQGEPIVTLSAGTPHRPPPSDERGFPIFESAAAARYLIGRGVPAASIFTESASWDTIGNAYFARVMHCEPAGWRRLAVITSGFHMPRTRRVFDWVFSLAPAGAEYALEFIETGNDGIGETALAARVEKERNALAALPELQASIADLRTLHRWLFVGHGAYAVGATPVPTSGDASDTY